jgi:phosphatidylinositol glycan class S
LLGLPPNPNQLTEWQLEALMRRRTTENVRDTKQTLGSIIRLVDSIKNMPVGDIVMNDVNNALEFLSQVS